MQQMRHLLRAHQLGRLALLGLADAVQSAREVQACGAVAQVSGVAAAAVHTQQQNWQQHWQHRSCCCHLGASGGQRQAAWMPLAQRQAAWERLQPWGQQAGARRFSSSATQQQEPPPAASASASKRLELARRRQMQHEFRSKTLGILFDPYRRPVPLREAGVLPNPVKTARFLWAQFRETMTMQFALREAAANIPGYDPQALVDNIAHNYKLIQQALAASRLDSIQDLVSREMLLKLRAQAEQRRLCHWDRIDWSLEDEDELASNVKVVHGRVQKSDRHSPLAWIQLTFRITCKQRFAAYRVPKGGRPELVKGSPDRVINVEDYWVFEHKTLEPADKKKVPVEGARWRLVGRLEL